MRFVFLKTEIFGQEEWAYVLDTEKGIVIKSLVMVVGAGGLDVKPEVRDVFAAPAIAVQPVVRPEHTPAVVVKADPAGEIETPAQREARLGAKKVSPAFLGDVRKMHLDPSKTDGKTDVTPFH